MPFLRNLIAVALLLVPFSAIAQGANVAVGTSSFDSTQPVEISSDELTVDQTTGEAIFDGNVLVVQGGVRMTAGRMTVIYETNDAGATTGISELLAEGGVTFVTETDAAEAETAVYTIESGNVVLTGNVLLTQGPNAISGERLVLDLNSGNGRMEGRVRTVINPARGGN